MNAALGHIGVLLGLAASVVGVAVIAYGLARHRLDSARAGRVYAALVLLGAVVATVAMERALLTHDFSLAFVAANNSRATPLLYTITGLWSALAGSILLWGLILAGYIAAMVWRFRRRAADPLVAWATLVIFVVAAFFFGLMVGPADPFRTVAGAVPANGLGPNALLQDNPLVAFHPPMLYLGFVGFTIPFAFAIASLITGRIGEGWQVATRRWTLFAWAFLTVGIVLGAWWSYQVLGWGGFWAWDPVENAVVPAVAVRHRLPPLGDRPGAPGAAAGLEPVARDRHLQPDHPRHVPHPVGGHRSRCTPSPTPTSGPLLLGFFGVVLATGVGLIAWRGDRLRSPGGIDSPLSREGAFLVNNLLFVGFAFVVLLGTVFPLLYEAFRGQQVTVGAPYFNAMTVPIGLALLFLMAVGPALPWRKTTVEHAARPADGAGLGRGARRGRGCVAAGVRGLGTAGRLRPGRVRRRRQRPPARAVGPRRRDRSGAGRVARARGAGQRRHGRAPRRGGDRRRTGRGHLVRAPRRGDAAAGPGRLDRRPSHRRSWASPTSRTPAPDRHRGPRAWSTGTDRSVPP